MALRPHVLVCGQRCSTSCSKIPKSTVPSQTYRKVSALSEQEVLLHCPFNTYVAYAVCWVFSMHGPMGRTDKAIAIQCDHD